MADEDLNDLLDAALRSPEMVQEGSAIVKQPNLTTLANAIQQLKAQRAAEQAQRARRLGPTYARFVPPGTQGP